MGGNEVMTVDARVTIVLASPTTQNTYSRCGERIHGNDMSFLKHCIK
jgi:hypothetical protein